MQMAKVFATTSEAKRLQVGCLLVQEDTIIAQGVNGTPKGWDTNQCETPEGVTAPHVKHAEINALNKLRRSHNSSSGATMFVTHAPCLMCAIDIVDAGVKKVYWGEAYRDVDGIAHLKKHQVEVEQLIIKGE